MVSRLSAEKTSRRTVEISYLPPIGHPKISSFRHINFFIFRYPLSQFGGKVLKIFLTQPFGLGQILYHFVSFMNEIFCSVWISQQPKKYLPFPLLLALPHFNTGNPYRISCGTHKT